MSKRLVLVDGSSFLFRAYHAVPPLNSPAGVPSNAVFGVANMLRKLISVHKTNYFTVVFDAKGKNFRHEMYPDYKAHRPPMDEELRVQIEPLHNLIRAMGLPVIMESGVEADDVLGALAQQAVREGFQVVISTGDKDMAQLVCENITLENTMSKTTLDIDGVMTKFGVKPNQIIDYLALMGDKSDNIPGVPKVGKKTAAKWLGIYGTVDNLVQHADEIKGKVGESLRANLELLSLSQQLTTIKCDLGLNYTMSDLKSQAPDLIELKQQLQQLGFSAWVQKLNTPSSNPIANPKKQTPTIDKDYQTILTLEQFATWLTRLEQADCFAFDTETNSLDTMQAEIVGLSFATKVGTAAYLPLAHDYPDAPQQLDKYEVLAALKPLLENPNKPKIGQNLKYDAHVLANAGIELQGIQHDTMLQSYVYNSVATKHNMDDLAKKYLDINTVHYEDITGKGAKQIGFAEVPLEQASPYAAEDADITLRLHHYFTEKLNQDNLLLSLYQELEIPLISVLTRIERNGVLIDTDMLQQQSIELESQLIHLEQQAHDLAEQVFNLSSPKQIQEILYDKLKLPILKKTPKGQPSTAESVLEELAVDYPLPKLIMEHRSLSKLKSTYTDKLPQQVNPNTGRIHTSYHQAVTATGRLSSSNPNLQNIPIRSEEGRKIRQAFIAPNGYQLVAADYSQIELRIMAHLSGDEGLLSAFSQGLDVHSSTASEVFNVSLDQVTPDLRRSAKAINFGLIYGMSAFGLAQQLGLNHSQAQSYIDLYFSRYPKVKKYMDNIKQQAKEQGYVETLFGRRLYLPEINAKQAVRRQYAERTAINAPMQGTAADIIKIAMIRTDAWLKQQHSSNKMIMQVHDELVFEVQNADIESFSHEIRNIMGSAARLDVPLLVDIGTGLHWDAAH